MSTPNGYNNPAYCHQYDSSLYDYQYVPEIDPDSPEIREESHTKTLQNKLINPNLANFQRESPESSEFDGSDESNRSIIIEECNNRRVTLICEKRNETVGRQDGFYDDKRFKAAYYQDISLESEKGYNGQEKNSKNKDEKSLRHQKALTPPEKGSVRIQTSSSSNGTRTIRKPSLMQSTTSINSFERPQRQHRYEEIPYDEDCIETKPPTSIHRYAEITVDENGYPTLSKEIKIEQRSDYEQNENHAFKIISKQRAISPIDYLKSFSPPQKPSRTPQKTTKEFDFSAPLFSPSSPSPIIYSSSPIKTNSFEMSELSPPRLSSEPQRGKDHTFFISSPKRQPPIGASGAMDSSERYLLNEKCVLPNNLQQITKSAKNYSELKSPRRRSFGQTTSPSQSQRNKKLMQIFHIKSNQPVYQITAGVSQKGNNTPARKNISHYFTDQPNDNTMAGSPYKPTTTEINSSKTAIITPILQRKSQQNQYCTSPLRNFEKTSQAFQSTGNIFRGAKGTFYPSDTNFLSNPSKQKIMNPVRIKRNQSVPNFSQSLAAESRMIARNQDGCEQENAKYSKNLDLQYSPKKPVEHLSPIDKSRISLIDQTSSWSTLDSEYHPRCSACFIFAALVHLVTASATCAISFYLLSKVGRKYYLDFGLLAGFVNFILGLLGFRSYCWRWLPNRNYVSGFMGLAAFSALTCSGLTYLITAKPMAGDPILDIMGGAICAISVLTIILALTGLTMSGCCKTPPPDNRVTDM